MEIIKLKKLLLRMLSGGCLSNCAITSLWMESELQGGRGRERGGMEGRGGKEREKEREKERGKSRKEERGKGENYGIEAISVHTLLSEFSILLAFTHPMEGHCTSS